MSAIQHELAHRLLPLICDATRANQLMTYRTAAEALGRDPDTNRRAVASVCDLLDAAAAFAGVPLLALITVREQSKDINQNAWKKNFEPGFREEIINRSLNHRFNEADFRAISEALDELEGKGNRAAWSFVRDLFPGTKFRRRLIEQPPEPAFDAIYDLGSDVPARIYFFGFRYARDDNIRKAVRERAGGKCEYCGELGFKCADGTRYIECHHIIALAADGEDRMTNVIALCPKDHREAHFGEWSAELERAMIAKLAGMRSLGR